MLRFPYLEIVLSVAKMDGGSSTVQRVEDADGVRMQAEFTRFIKEFVFLSNFPNNALIIFMGHNYGSS